MYSTPAACKQRMEPKGCRRLIQMQGGGCGDKSAAHVIQKEGVWVGTRARAPGPQHPGGAVHPGLRRLRQLRLSPRNTASELFAAAARHGAALQLRLCRRRRRRRLPPQLAVQLVPAVQALVSERVVPRPRPACAQRAERGDRSQRKPGPARPSPSCYPRPAHTVLPALHTL